MLVNYLELYWIGCFVSMCIILSSMFKKSFREEFFCESGSIAIILCIFLSWITVLANIFLGFYIKDED